MNEMKPGIYEGLTQQQYTSIDALNQSELKKFVKNPQAFADGLPEVKSASFAWGNLFELLLLDPMSLGEHYALLDDAKENELTAIANTKVLESVTFSKRLSAYKEWALGQPEGDIDGALTEAVREEIVRKTVHSKAKKFSKRLPEYTAWAEEQEASGKTVIDSAMLASCVLAVSRAEREPNIESLFALGGESQVAIVWTDPITNLKCKGLIDWVPNKISSLVDVKTTASLTDVHRNDAKWKIRNTVRSYGYDFQAAYYLWGWNLAREQSGMSADVRDSWLFLFSQNQKPWAAAAYSLSKECIDSATDRVRMALQEWQACQSTGNFPGLTSTDHWPELPSIHEKL